MPQIMVKVALILHILWFGGCYSYTFTNLLSLIQVDKFGCETQKVSIL